MGVRLLNDSSLVFTSANPYEVSEYVNRHVGNHGLTLSGKSSGSASLSHRKAGNLDLCRLSYGAPARIRSEGLPEIYHIQFILRGHCQYELDRESLSLPAGHILLLNPDEPIDLTYSADCEKFIVRIPASLFNEACLEHRWFKPREYIKFNRTPYRFEELNGLVQLMQLLCEEAESSTSTPQLLQHYNRVVTSKLMTILKHNVSLTQAPQTDISFERVVQYIEDNIKRDISAEELAQYARMSLRSLYSLFEKNAQTTPKNFVRQKKLEQVYATLMNPACEVANVTAVALDYGFTHLGRFSEFYKTAFGVLPSESFKERQGRN